MKSKKPAFTLVEILIVVGIIVTLLGMTIAISGSIFASQDNARAKTEISTMARALEEFKSKYGSYPRLSCATSEKQNAALLYQCLTGKMIMTQTNGTIVFKEYKGSTPKPLINVAEMTIADTSGSENPDPEGSNTFFVDPWGEPYIYLYNASTSLGKSTTWKSPSFILLSKGPDMKASKVGSMYTSGEMNDIEYYKSTGKNEDNILNGID